MSPVPPSPLLRRVPPGVWTALAWCSGTVFTFLVRMRLPGESMDAAYPGVLFHRWDGRTTLALATAVTLIGCALLRRRPLTALGLVLGGAVLGTVPLSVDAIPLPQFLSVDAALYLIAATGRRGVSLAAAGLVFAALTAYLAVRLAHAWPIGTSTELAVAMTALVAWLVGDSTRQARELGALRQAELEDGASVPDEMPGLADVDRLAEATTAAGVRVDVRWLGERRPLPPEIDLSAYRIIQEAVTNVVRHAGASSCTVTIDHRDEEISIEVIDDGHGPGTTPGTGYGLIGMRERAALLHGDLTAAPRPEGGFRVAVRLPLPAGVGR